MTDKKISALSSGNPAQSGDELPIARSGANYKVTAGSIAALSPPTDADTIIGEFPALTSAAPLDGSEILGVDDAGTSKKATVQNIIDAVLPTASNTPLAPIATPITTGAAPGDADPTVRYYEITTGGTAGTEFLNLPNLPTPFDGYANGQAVGQRITFIQAIRTNGGDVVKMTVEGSATFINVLPKVPGFDQTAAFASDITLTSVGSMVSFVWVGDSWAFDRGATDRNFNEADENHASLIVPNVTFQSIPTIDPETSDNLWADNGHIALSGATPLSQLTGVQDFANDPDTTQNGAKATGVLTLTDVGIDTETIDIGDETYTLVPAAAAPFEVTIGADATETGDNLVTTIGNDSALVSGVNVAGVVTVTALLTGTDANAFGTTTDVTGASWGDVTLTGGLDIVYGYKAGLLSNAGVIVSVNAGTVMLADDDTNYIEVDSAGTVTTNQSAFNTAKIAMAVAVTSGADITSTTDKRSFLSIPVTGDSGSFTTADLQTVTVVNGIITDISPTP